MRKAKSKQDEIAPIAVIDTMIHHVTIVSYGEEEAMFQLLFRFKWQFYSHITSPHALLYWINIQK